MSLEAPSSPAEKLRALRQALAAHPSAVVAFSGGVDSTFVLRIAREEIGDGVLALTTTSASMPARELAEARRLAEEIGARHEIVSTDEVAIEDYAKNPINRCYFCKDNLYRICHEEASRLGIGVILDGVNADDLGDHRPGLDAASEQRVLHPLVEAGLTKDEVRLLSSELGLPTWDKPASPCLASRFAYGTAITHEALGRVESAEEVLWRMGFREFRVRYEDDTARLEIARAEIGRCFDESVRDGLSEGIRACGFRRVVLDLDGFRSGSLNDVLRDGSE